MAGGSRSRIWKISLLISLLFIITSSPIALFSVGSVLGGIRSTVIDSSFGTPIIDGSLDEGEWAGLQDISLTLDYSRYPPPPYLPPINGTLSVMHDLYFLYIGAELYQLRNRTVSFNIILDDGISEPYGNGMRRGIAFYGCHESTIEDYCRKGDLISDYEDETLFWASAPLIIDEDEEDPDEFAWNHTGTEHMEVGNYTFEFAIPFRVPEDEVRYSLEKVPEYKLHIIYRDFHGDLGGLFYTYPNDSWVGYFTYWWSRYGPYSETNISNWHTITCDHLPMPLPPTFLILGGGLLVIIIVVAIYLFRRHKRQKALTYHPSWIRR